MTLGVTMWRWHAAFAFACMLAATTPAAAQAQQPPAAAQAGYLGAGLRTLTRAEAQVRGVPGTGGAAITKVEADSPAAAAGLKRGDILIEADGNPVASAEQFLKLAASHAPGTVVKLQVLREGKVRAGPVKLGAKPDAATAAAAPGSEPVPAVAAAAEAAAQDKEPVEIVPQLGHSDEVRSVAISPDGKTALSGSWDRTLRLWDLSSGREIRKFEGHSGKVQSVAISPDGSTALSGSEGQNYIGPGELKLWDLASGREIRKFVGHSSAVTSVAIAPGGETALSASWDNTLRLWDLASGREIKKFEGYSGPVAYAPDGKTVLSGACDELSKDNARCVKGSLRLLELARGRNIRKLVGHSGKVQSLAIAPDGKTALSGACDEYDAGEWHCVRVSLRLWDLASGREIKKIDGYSGPVTYAPDGKTALSGGLDLTLKLWDLANGREIRSFGVHWVVLSVAIAPDGKTALSGGGGDHTARLWDLASGREIKKFEGHSREVKSIAIAPDGKTALWGSLKMLKLWDLANGREIGKFDGDSWVSDSVAIAPDGKTALSGSFKTLELWDLATGRKIGKFVGHSGSINSVAFAPDGKTALSGSQDKTLRLWDLASGREIKKFEGHSDSVASVAFAPDGKTALSGGGGETWGTGEIRLWDLANAREIRKFEGPSSFTSVAITREGKTALSGSLDNTLRLWDLASGREIRKFEGHSGTVNSVAIAPDGKTALSGSSDRTLRLWNLTSGHEIRKFVGHSSEVRAVTIAPDGKSALSGSDDGTVRLWNLQSGEALASFSASRDDDQLSITSKGFFTASQRDTDMLAIVRGLEVTTIGQVHQSLFNPDLVREALAGDPDGEVKRAAEVISLDKVLDAGPPPAVAIISHQPGSHSGTDLVTLAARITDRGKGIGRIEWRLNGVTAGVTGTPARAGLDYEVTQELALDPGENRIEVIAYEGRNLLASLPAQTSIVYDGPTDTVKPKLHILAIASTLTRTRAGQRRARMRSKPFRRSDLRWAMPKPSRPRWKRPPPGFIARCACGRRSTRTPRPQTSTAS